MKTTLALCLSLLACSSTTETVNKGTAPTLSNLTLSPTEVTVGKATALTGSADFTDAEGDVDSLAGEIVLSDGQKTSLPKSPFSGASGQKQGTAVVAALLQVPVAGEVTLSVWIVDKEGNESNKLSAKLTAKP